MNWSEVRNYIISKVQVVDSDMDEWRESFTIENVPSTSLDTHFQITFNNIEQVPNQGKFVEDFINITVNIWKQGCNDPVEALDELLDKALCIRQEVISPTNVESFGWNGVVNSTSVTPSPIDETNDNVMRVAMDFSIRLFLNL